MVGDEKKRLITSVLLVEAFPDRADEDSPTSSFAPLLLNQSILVMRHNGDIKKEKEVTQKKRELE